MSRVEVARLTGPFGLVTVEVLDVLAQARGRGDRLLARVFTDEALERLEGHPPVMPLAERLRLVGALRDVADVEVAADLPTHLATRLVTRLVTDDAPDRPSDADEAYAWEPGPDAGPAVLLRPRVGGVRLPDASELLAPRSPGRGAGLRTGYVPGGWDVFHVGHLRILERARAQCDRLVVGVVTDEGLVAAKGRPPVVPFAKRAAVVAAFDLVDEVVTDTSSDKRLAWERVGFDVLFKGDDWQGTAKGDRLEAEMAEVGVELRYFPYTAHTSSTALRAVLDAR